MESKFKYAVGDRVEFKCGERSLRGVIAKAETYRMSTYRGFPTGPVRRSYVVRLDEPYGVQKAKEMSIDEKFLTRTDAAGECEEWEDADLLAA